MTAPPPIRLPSGVRDYLPRAAHRRRALADRIERVFAAWGYAGLITPIYEHADVLDRGQTSPSQAIRFVEPGTGEVVALRPDITPQVARIVATRLADAELPLRLCYEGTVMRLAGELGQREILQAGIELVGAGEPEGDAEVLAVAAAALAATGLPETRLDIGHVAPAKYVLATVEDPGPLTAALARKDRGGLRAATRDLPPPIQTLAQALPTLWGSASDVIARALPLPWPDEVRASIEQLRAVLAAFAELADPPAPELTIDLGDVRGFDYYTGVRFAGYASGAPDAVLRGGRYDELIGRYGRAHRATGFAIDLEMLAQAERGLGIDPPALPRGVAVYGPNAAAVARVLRARGTRVVVCAAPPSERWLRAAGLDESLDASKGDV